MRTSRVALRSSRRGNIVVLTVFLLIGMVGCLAFALDLGVIYTARTELQRSADAAALAATWRLLEDQIATLGEISRPDGTVNARAVAEQYARLNTVASEDPELGGEDVQVGHYVERGESGVVDPGSTLYTNAVRVRVQRSSTQNGQIRLLFARVLGVDQLGLECDATAAFWCGFSGFEMPQDGSNLGMIPITLDRETYEYAFLARNGEDNYTYNPDTGEVTVGPDDIPELNLYPQGSGPPGNRGTVDFGSDANSTQDLERQILYGLSAEDLAYHGGSLAFDDNGELGLDGDTGISAAIQSALDEIKGRPRMIPIFDSVSGNGDNAHYTVTGFTGIRVLHVKLSGAMKNKEVIVQPAPIQTRGGIKDEDGSNRTTLIFSPVALVE